ncbi:MAG: aminotransferase class V-fold PLP-dependent enzyme, partial [Nocardioides sp.]
PVDELAATLPEARIFCDLAASVGQEPLPQGWVVGAASAHKWGGPAGVGLLLVRRGAGWRAPFPVDDRTDPRGVGFENVPAALAASASLQAVMADLAESGARRRALTTHLRQRLAALPDVVVLGEPSERLPHVVAFSCLYVDGEVLVSELDRRGYAVHSGSACVSSDAVGPSHVLEAMGVLTHGNVRVSLPLQASALPDEDGLDRFVAAVELVLTEQRAVLGL